MAGHDIIVAGASAGGVEALRKLVSTLPADLPATVFIVLHLPAQSLSLLPQILSRAGPLRAHHPTDGEAIQQGQIYVAPSDHHLLVEEGMVRVVRGPKENRHRPAIDPLFRSAARTYGPRVVGIILTGSLDDGTAGLLAIKQCGGVAVVQDPDEALFASMPLSAITHVGIDHILPLSKIGPLLGQLLSEQADTKEVFPLSKDMEVETRLATMDMNTLNNEEHIGTPSIYSCPECHGVLWEVLDGNLLRFRCRVGHAYSIESVLAGQSEAVEQALWAALKNLEESLSLSRRMTMDAHTGRKNWLARRFEEREQEMQRQAALIQQALVTGEKKTTLNTGAEIVATEEDGTIITPRDAHQ